MVLIGRPAPCAAGCSLAFYYGCEVQLRGEGTFPSATLGTRGKMELGKQSFPSKCVPKQSLGTRGKFMKKFRPLVLLSVGLLSAAGLTPVARAKTPVASDRPVENVTPVASDRPVDLNVGDLQMVAEFEQQVVGVAVSASGRVFVSFPRNG